MIGRTVRRGARVGATTAAVAGVLVLALAGCQTGAADDGGDGGSGAGGSGGSGGDVPDVSGDGTTLVLQVDVAGGFVPWGYEFGSVPGLSIYADGTAVVPGPTTLEYPGAVLPNLQVVTLPDGALDEIVAAALDADLLVPPAAVPDYGQPNITDMPGTTVTIVVGGETFVHSAYALGSVEGESGPDDPGMFDGGDSGLTEDQAAARVVLAQFLLEVQDLVGATGAEDAYPVSALGVLAAPVPEDQPVEEGFEPTVVPWPLADVPLAGAGECAIVEGDDAQTLLATLADANQLTQFEQDAVVYQAWFRPLLPHETSCADLVG